MRVITDSWVMAAMIRSEPRRQKGQMAIQVKHAPQKPSPDPGRCASFRLLPVHTLLARCRDNRLSQLAVRRQTASIADEVDTRQGH